MDLNPTILGRKLFPSSEKLKEYGRTIAEAFTPAAGTPPPTMAGVTVPPDGASLSQLQFKGPLLGTGPMFAVKGTPAPTPQPEPVKTDIGAYAATRFPFSFDVAKTQTPSMQQPNIAALTGGAQLPSFTPTTQAPIMPPKEPRQMIQTPYGTIYATAGQKQSFESNRNIYEGRTPAEQQALLAKMRQRGADKMSGNIKAQEQYFAQKAQERAGLRLAEAEAKARGFSPIEIMKAREASQPSNFAGIVRQAAQYSQRLPMEGVATSAISKFSRALPSGGPYSTVYGGAPINRLGSVNPYSNTSAEQRKKTRQIARSMGLQPAYSRPIQAAQELLFRERGLM